MDSRDMDLFSRCRPSAVLSILQEPSTGGGLCKSVKLRRIPMPEGVDNRVHRGLRP